MVDMPVGAEARLGHKLAKGFNTTDVPLELCLLNGEIAGAFDAWRKTRPDLVEELAYAAIFLVGLAQMVGANLPLSAAGNILARGRSVRTLGSICMTHRPRPRRQGSGEAEAKISHSHLTD
jgi:hypothetical protein